MPSKQKFKTVCFKHMGETILKGERPTNMADFLKGANFEQSPELRIPRNNQKPNK